MNSLLRWPVIIMGCVCVVVNTIDSVAVEFEHKKKSKPSLEEFIQRLIVEGNDLQLGVGRPKLLDIPPHSLTKAIHADDNESLDGQGRSFEVVVKESSPAVKPLCLLFTAGKSDLAKKEDHNFSMRVSTAGTLEKMFFGIVKMDSEGNAIRGSGTHEFQDVNSPKIQKMFKYELEFWLEGKHRKKKPAAGKDSKPKAELKP